MSSSTTVLPPAAATGAVAQAEVETIELSPPSTSSTLPIDPIQQQHRIPPGFGSKQSRRFSIPWTIVKMPSMSFFHSLGPKCWEALGRYKTGINNHKIVIYKNSFKILGLLCGLGALTLAWIALKSPPKPTDVDIQTLNAMNRTADGQTAVYEVLKVSLNKLREELQNEKKQLEVDQELLQREKEELNIQKWFAQRQFIKECVDYQRKYNMTSSRCSDAIKAWDELPPFLSEAEMSSQARRRPLNSPPGLSSQQSLITDWKRQQMDSTQLTTDFTHPAPAKTSRVLPNTSSVEHSSLKNINLLSSGQVRYLDHFLTHFIIGFLAFTTASLFLVYVARLLRRRAFGQKTVFSKSGKIGPAEILPYDMNSVVIRNTAISDSSPVGSRNRRATSSQYRKGDIWTAAYSGSLEAIASFRAENRYTNVNEISPRLGTPLQAACQGGQLETAKSLLKWGADPNLHGGRFKTCLVAAAYSGNFDILQLVLDRYVSVNEYSEIAGSALHAACERGSQRMVELLVARGADVKASGGSYGTPLQAASFRGNPTVVSLLLEKGAEANIKGGQYGTCLHAAAVDGHVEAAELLLGYGADVNAKTETYGTALQVACQGDHTRLARVLIDHGASFETLDEHNHTPLHHASRLGDEYLVEVLLKRGVAVDAADADGYTALHYAASFGHPIVAEILLRYGANTAVQDKFGAQPLFRAASLTYVEVVRTLLRAGAQVDAKDNYGKTAMHDHHDNIEIIELLLDAGAEINNRADDGKTPLHRAAEVANLETLRLLVRRGADLNLEDNDQATPLLAAVKGDCKDVPRERLDKAALYLLQQPGIDINSRNSAAFQEAVAQDLVEVIEAMLVKNVSLNSQGWRYGSTVQAAACNGSVELMRRLLNLGANANIQGGEFGTALQAAAFFGNTAILVILLDHGVNVNTTGGRFGYALTAARKGKAKAGVKVEIMRLLKQWGAKEDSVASRHEKERWVLTPSRWVWLPATRYMVSQNVMVDVKDTGD